MIGKLPVPQPCRFNRRMYPNNSTWEHECNSCRCVDGVAECSKVWCGPQNCLIHPNLTEPVLTCNKDQTCVVQTEETCFTPPCLPWGQCRNLNAIMDPKPPGVHTNCLPNNEFLDNNCAKITIVFNKAKMPTVSLTIYGPQTLSLGTILKLLY